MISVMTIITLAVIFAIFPIVLGWIPYRNARDNTPEKITVYHDRIIFDKKIFKFRDITKISMTTPNTEGPKAFRRKIIITVNNLTKIYTLGDDTDKIPDNIRRKKNVKVFGDYDVLFGALWNIFKVKAEEGKPSIFTSVIE